MHVENTANSRTIAHSSVLFLENHHLIRIVEGVKAHQEACLLHSPLKWVDEDETSITSEHNQNFNVITTNGIGNRLISEDDLNGNFNIADQDIAMVNEIVDSVDNRCNSTSDNKENYRSEYKTLNRGISRATDNVNIVSRVRSELALVDNTDEEYLSIETPVYTFTLPDFTQFPDDFREFLEKDLISISTQSSLEQANRLNWWTSFAQRLWPLSTSGDGNCLLHAASLGVWGFHDRLLTLRRNLHSFLSQSTYREALWRRWKRQQSILNAQAGLVYSEVEWRREWNAIVSMASTTPRLRRQSIVSAGKGDLYGNIYESLEEIHVLALAHLLKRPIIVVADTMLKDMNGEALAPIPFGGVYLPVECAPKECHRSPLLLAYDGGHFSALVAMDSSNHPNTPAIPLVDSSNELLCIQFHTDPGENEEEDFSELSFNDSISLLNEYLDVVRLDPQGNNSENNKNGLLGSLGRSMGNKLRLKLTRSNSVRNNTTNKSGHVLCALLHTDRRHEYHDVMIKNYLQNAMERFQQTNAGAPRYGAGKSQFYTEVDAESHEKVSQLTPVKAATNNDPTLYLSKSTFYETGIHCRAENCTFFGNAKYDYYCSKCYQDRKKTI